MREQEKIYKRKMHCLELENVEWREKCKYAEMRNFDQLDRKEIRSEVTRQELMQQIPQNEDAFGDIKSLIDKFKRER